MRVAPTSAARSRRATEDAAVRRPAGVRGWVHELSADAVRRYGTIAHVLPNARPGGVPALGDRCPHPLAQRPRGFPARYTLAGWNSSRAALSVCDGRITSAIRSMSGR